MHVRIDMMTLILIEVAYTGILAVHEVIYFVVFILYIRLIQGSPL